MHRRIEFFVNDKPFFVSTQSQNMPHSHCLYIRQTRLFGTNSSFGSRHWNHFRKSFVVDDELTSINSLGLFCLVESLAFVWIPRWQPAKKIHHNIKNSLFWRFLFCLVSQEIGIREMLPFSQSFVCAQLYICVVYFCIVCRRYDDISIIFVSAFYSWMLVSISYPFFIASNMSTHIKIMHIHNSQQIWKTFMAIYLSLHFHVSIFCTLLIIINETFFLFDCVYITDWSLGG